MTRDFGGVGQLDNPVGALCAYRCGFLGRQNLHAKTLRLHYRSPCQITSAETGGEAKIILDARTHSRLPPRRFPFDNDRVQSLRSTVNGCRKPGGAAANNRQVVEIGLSTRT